MLFRRPPDGRLLVLLVVALNRGVFEAGDFFLAISGLCKSGQTEKSNLPREFQRHAPDVSLRAAEGVAAIPLIPVILSKWSLFQISPTTYSSAG